MPCNRFYGIWVALEDFKVHIGSEHEAGIGERELDLIAEECFEVLHEDTLAGPCPFPCAVDLDNMVNREREEHIAKHLISLAQKSLMDYDPIGPLDYGSAAGVSSRFGSDSAQIKDSLNDRIEFTEEEDNTQDSQDSNNIELSEDMVHSNEIEVPSPTISDWSRVCDHIRTQSTPMDYSLSSDPKLKGFVERHENKGSDVEEISSGLRMLIVDNLILSGFEKTPHRFLPEGVIDDIVTEERLLIQVPSPDEDKLLDYIKLRAKKIFAILIYIRPHSMRSALDWWRKKDMGDRDLPFRIQPAWKKQSWFTDFQESQWTFLAPIFSTAGYNHDLHEEHILPFISKEWDADRGSFAVVSRYTIHNKHLHPALLDYSPIAVKEIQPSYDAQEIVEHWEREVKALRTLNELNHDHIVRFVTAFRRHREHGGPDHYLVFEWADGGNLRSMWKREHSPILTAALVKDAMFQILGLARALEAAHNLDMTGASYRHGDIKPENILCFSNGRTIGTLKIDNWGEAKEHGQVTELRPSKTTAKYGTSVYQAPEVETGVRARYLGQSTKRRSRLYDVWAMGCITLEFTIWLLEGTISYRLHSFRGES
ncbi:uncharacterized protein J4E79_003472 [Alternaria viburni]|uniref:uncharacterized protein n=1 Tax=Alternaria viburni TaxID=566460 RepID=UPI0020C4BD18|nr:uncharacterized protein J4E79_003472 [Alternaria viburni]KAI4663972.1 hypothetical protein J4E79_003472 [Alternaria viburni]